MVMGLKIIKIILPNFKHNSFSNFSCGFLNPNYFFQFEFNCSNVYRLVMSPSWNFPARAEPSYEDSEPSQAELGHFNFRAETELKTNFFSHFSQVSIVRFCLCIHTGSNFFLIVRFLGPRKKRTNGN